MKTIITTIILMTVSLGASSAPTEASVTFRPCLGVTANVTATKANIDYSLMSSVNPKRSLVPLEIETQPHISIEDYNFDGHKDFSVWYLDEGMGKYTIHRVFIYESKSQIFSEVVPRCGEEFLNLKVDKVKRRLISTYYSNNRAMICSTRLKKEN